MTDWQQGIQALRHGRLREAADRLSSAADDHERTVTVPARFQTLTHLGAALYALGRAAEAVEAFEAARRLAPPPAPPAELEINLANAYLAAGRVADAQRVLEEALQDYPGHMEAQMLLDRLGQRDSSAPMTGAALGESPAGLLRYLRSLTFRTVPAGGFDPAQVRLALGQIERHIEYLVHQVLSQREAIERLEAEREAAYIALDAARAAAESSPATAPEPSDPSRARLDALLRQKPPQTP